MALSIPAAWGEIHVDWLGNIAPGEPPYVTVYGLYANSDGTPGVGYLELVPAVSAAHLAGPMVVTQDPIRVALASDGSFAATIFSSDAVEWKASNPVPYIFREFVDGRVAQWMAYVDGPGPVDITDLVELSETPEFPPGADLSEYLRIDQADVPNGYLPIRSDGRVGDVIFTGIQTATTHPVDTDGPELATLDFVHAQVAADIASQRSFDFNKVVDFLNIPDTWTEINSLTVDRPAGTYIFGLSLTMVYDVTNRSALLRFSTDGGQTWNDEWVMEPSDGSNRMPITYQYPFEHTGGSRTVIMQARKSAAGGTFSIPFSDLYVQRVG